MGEKEDMKEPNQKKRKLSNILNLEIGDKDKELLNNMPFTEKELEESDYDETEFMDKLSSYLEKKYDDDNDDDNELEDDDIDLNKQQLSMLDIFTMKEEELNKIMPIDDCIDTLQSKKTEKVNKRKTKNRKKKQYRKPPRISKKKKQKK